jgi:acetyltransferase-like isoleucine patch superfamily enzyme
MKDKALAIIQLFFSLGMYITGTLFYGLALTPGVALILHVWSRCLGQSLLVRSFALGISVAGAYFLFGLCLIFLVGLTRTLLFLRPKEGRHRLLSYDAAKWAFTNSLYLLVNFTFIYFILLTPFANWFLRMLGAKLGKNVQINSKFIFDAALLEIGDNTVVGGGAIIIGHQVQRGVLTLKKVCIGSNVTIGSNAIIAPGCTIGDSSIIGAGTVLQKNTVIPERSIWHGVPGESVRKRPPQPDTSNEN